ncbi:MAG TPA: Hpt domain-containing protein, partial [Tenuifilaceae bacterium]|nr:Hpt domain-containing protein [Tenuifilaceae bacterium]
MESFKKKFIEEAVDLLEGLEKSLLALEDNPEDSALIQQVFRVMHTLKGNSGMFGFDLIDSFTHEMETVYDLIRNGKLRVTREVLDVTLAAVDHLKCLLDEENYNDSNVISNHNELLSKVKLLTEENLVAETNVTNEWHKNSPDEEQIKKEKTYYISFEPIHEIFDNGTNPLYLIEELHSVGQVAVFAHLNKVPSLKELKPEYCYTYWEVLIATSANVNDISDVFMFVEHDSTLDIQEIADVNLLADELFVGELTRLAATQKDIGLTTVQNLSKNLISKKLSEKIKEFSKDQHNAKRTSISSIRVSADKLDKLMNLVSELVTTQARLSLFAEENSTPGLLPIAENVQKLSRQLRDIAFSIVLIPIENMLTRFQRLIRDLSQELGKEVVFITEGAETELDKTIIENLADPLMHILRNSLDHGIEDKELRLKRGKPPQGKVSLKAFYSGANVMIQISDDGAGIDPEMISEKAIGKGIISPDRKLTKREILDLVFLPGFS